MSKEAIRRGAMMYVSAVEADLPMHIAEKEQSGAEGYAQVSQSLKQTGRWLNIHGAVSKTEDGKWAVNDAAIDDFSGNSRDYERLHDRMLHDHDRVAPTMRESGFGGYLDEFTEARVGPLPERQADASHKSNKIDFFAHLDAPDASGQSVVSSDAALDDFLSKKPKEVISAMDNLDFSKSDKVGYYLLEAIQKGDSEGILAAQSTGVDLSTKMSAPAKRAQFGDAHVQGDMSFIHVAAMTDEDAIPAKNLADPAIDIRDVNIKDGNGDTALHLAAAHTSPEHVEAWLSKGANPNARNNQAMTPSMEAGLHNRNENTAVLEMASASYRENKCSEVAARLHANRSNARASVSKPRDRGIDLSE